MPSYDEKLRREIARRDNAMKAAKHHASYAAESVGLVYTDAKNSVTGMVSDARETVTGVYSDAKQTMTGVYSDAKQTMTGVYSDAKVNLNPRKLVGELRDEYDPAKVVAKYPWSTIVGAAAAGFILTPIARSAFSQPTTRPRSAPQRIIIEVAGLGGENVTATARAANAQPAATAVAAPKVDLLTEILALFGGVNGIMELIKPYVASFLGGSKPTAREPVKPAANGTHERTAAPEPAPAPHPSISRRYAPPPSDS